MTIIFYLFILFFSSRSLAGGHVVSIEEKQLPEYLYHWMDQRELSQQWRLDSLETSGKLPIPFMRGEYPLLNSIPQFSGRPGLYTWHNPVTALIGNTSQVNGNMLLTIKTATKSFKVLTIETGKEEDPTLPDFSDIDIILHRRYHQRQKEPLYEEWIIINPEIASYFTVNPEVNKEIVKTQYDKMKAGYQFSYDEVHYKKDFYEDYVPYNDAGVRELIFANIEKYFEKSTSDVPPIWLKRSECFDVDALLKTYLQ